MNKVFMFLGSLFLLSCSKKNEFKESISINENISFIKNDTIKHIIDRIIEGNDPFKVLQINLLEDNKDFIEIILQIDDMVFDCSQVKGVFHYKDKIIIMENLSDNPIFDRLFDFSKDNFLDDCYEFENNIIMPGDPIGYPFKISKEGIIMYSNGDTLIYNQGKLKLNFWK